MAKRCLIETCKREAETFCYHCSRDVCTKHYLEHKNWIQEQLHPLVDEMNLIYDRFRYGDQKSTVSELPYLTTVRNQLDRWRDNCHRQIDTTYERIRKQMQTIIDNYKLEETQKSTKNLETLEKLRQRLKDLLKDDDVTHRQLEIIKQQLDDIKKTEQEPIKYPNIRIITQKIEFDKYINITTDIKPSSDKLHTPRSTLNKYKC